MTILEKNYGFNFKVEMLSDDELEKVSGGDTDETANDSRFLNILNGSTNRYGKWKIMAQNHEDEIRNAWSKVGVDAEIHSGNFLNFGKRNIYKINGKQVTQEEARKHAMQVTGYFITRAQWDW